MKITDLFDRGRVQQPKDASGPQAYHTTFKWSPTGGPMVAGRGETQQAADQACLEAIRRRFRGTFTPLCLSYRGSTLIVFRNGDEWWYGRPVPERAELAALCRPGDCQSRDDAERAARRHLAEVEWDEQEETSNILLHPDDQVWFLHWSRQQKGFLAQWRALLHAGWTREEAMVILAGGQPDPTRVEELGNPQDLLREHQC